MRQSLTRASRQRWFDRTVRGFVLLTAVLLLTPSAALAQGDRWDDSWSSAGPAFAVTDRGWGYMGIYYEHAFGRMFSAEAQAQVDFYEAHPRLGILARLRYPFDFFSFGLAGGLSLDDREVTDSFGEKIDHKAVVAADLALWLDAEAFVEWRFSNGVSLRVPVGPSLLLSSSSCAVWGPPAPGEDNEPQPCSGAIHEVHWGLALGYSW